MAGGKAKEIEKEIEKEARISEAEVAVQLGGRRIYRTPQRKLKDKLT